MKKVWGFVLAGLVASLLLATLVSPFASKAPDGLEKVAEEKGFAAKGEGPAVWRFPLMPGYAVPGVRSESVSTALAGLAGTVVVFGVAFGAAKVLSRRRGTHQNLETGKLPLDAADGPESAEGEDPEIGRKP
jgi:cobalt/nickel transport protein